MKSFLSFLVVAVIVLIVLVQFVAVPKAESIIQSQLNDFGFKHTRIEGSKIAPTGLTIKKLTLDKDEFSVLEDVKITVFWPALIIEKEIDKIEISKASLSSTLEEVYKKTLFDELPIKQLAKIDAKKITLKNLSWDIGTANKAYRIEASAYVVKEGDVSKLSAHIKAEQQALRFDVRLNGDVSVQSSHIEASVEGFDLKLEGFNINRASGWFDFKDAKNGEEVSSQLIASSGDLFGLPLQDIQWTLGRDEKSYPVIFRAKASGIDGVNVAIDTHASVEIPNQMFHAVLSIQDTVKFRDYLGAHNISNDNLNSFFSGDEGSLVKFVYLPERRFAGGPYPLSLEVEEGGKRSATGTVLLYPNNFDVRGTIEGEDKKLQSIQQLFSLSEENLSNKSLRLTGSAKDYL